jgi:hypothetical protein
MAKQISLAFFDFFDDLTIDIYSKSVYHAFRSCVSKVSALEPLDSHWEPWEV